MSRPPESPESKRPGWLLPLGLVFLALVAWILFSGGVQTNSQLAAPNPAQPPADASPPPSAPATPGPHPNPPVAAAPPEAAAEAPAPSPEVRQQREELFQKLTASNDPTLAAVQTAFAAQGLKEPAVIASGWILAQHWAICARSEALVQKSIEDEARRKELLAASRTILIQSAETEIRGLAGTSLDARIFADLETLGRGLKDQPAPAADLLPDRALGARQRGAKRPRSTLPPEE